MKKWMDFSVRPKFFFVHCNLWDTKYQIQWLSERSGTMLSDFVPFVFVSVLRSFAFTHEFWEIDCCEEDRRPFQELSENLLVLPFHEKRLPNLFYLLWLKQHLFSIILLLNSVIRLVWTRYPKNTTATHFLGCSTASVNYKSIGIFDFIDSKKSLFISRE